MVGGRGCLGVGKIILNDTHIRVHIAQWLLKEFGADFQNGKNGDGAKWSFRASGADGMGWPFHLLKGEFIWALWLFNICGSMGYSWCWSSVRETAKLHTSSQQKVWSHYASFPFLYNLSLRFIFIFFFVSLVNLPQIVVDSCKKLTFYFLSIFTYFHTYTKGIYNRNWWKKGSKFN